MLGINPYSDWVQHEDACKDIESIISFMSRVPDEVTAELRQLEAVRNCTEKRTRGDMGFKKHVYIIWFLLIITKFIISTKALFIYIG